MKGLLLGLLAAAGLPSSLSAAPPVLNSGDWMFNGNAGDACVLQAEGRASDVEGARLDVRCERDAQILGNVVTKLVAATLRQRRVTIAAEVHAGEDISASLWLKTARGAATLSFDNDAEQNLTSTISVDGWTQRSITLAVEDDADTVSFGVLLRGGGAVAVRNLHFTVSSVGPVSPAAQHVLDAALNIIKAQTIARHDIAWRVVETQARIFAVGAQDTAEVYPAIKYVLAQLGDKHSSLLTPELVNLFDDKRDMGSVQASTSVRDFKIFTLPDGSNLVLSAVLEPGKRMARNANKLKMDGVADIATQ